MDFLIVLLVALMLLDCLALMLLVLIQLPKKEAGAGLAFGAGAADALLGAGSGNALTKVTKYCAGTFLALSLGLGVMNSKIYRGSESDVRKALTQKAAAPVTTPAAPAKPESQFKALLNTNALAPVPPATNAAPPTNLSAATKAATPNTNAPAQK